MNDIDDLKYNFGCASCGYKQIEDDRPRGHIPVARVIEKLDDCFSKNDMPAAGKLLEYWQEEAKGLNDRQGELSIVNEMLGYYRKVGDAGKGIAAVERADVLILSLGAETALSSATIYLNMGTTLKAFGKPDEALPYYQRCFAIYNNSLEDDDPLFGGFYNNYGLCQQDLGLYEDAKMSFLFAAKIMQKQENGKGDAAISYVNLAHCLEEWRENCETVVANRENHLSEAIGAMNTAYELLCADDLLHDKDLAYTLSKCWPSFEHFGFKEEAAALRKESEQIYSSYIVKHNP